MKNFFLLLFCFLSIQSTFGQLNMTYKSNVTYNESLNDIWGYAAPDGREYALVGLRNGVSVIDVTDTENPGIKGYADGPSSTWRDMKEYNGYAYVTNESSGGLLVIDLTGLPNELTADDYYYWAPNLSGLGTLSSCHNIYIDENGYAYLVGCNLNQGGMIILDVFSTPGTPEYVAPGPPVYAHDIYVRNNIAYNSEIYAGAFAAYDVSDKTNVIELGSQNTPFNFTHNAWLSDDGDFLFTTDEQANAPVGSYDVSDLSDIKEVDQFRPLETLGDGVIPHNVHVWNDWIIISYYTDGCIIVDGSRPSNLIEVGNFDTYIPSGTGFSGAWGAYPFLPSGTVLVSDIGNGVYILEPNYVRACWLEGQVTDANTGDPINNVSIDIQSSQINQTNTNTEGNYSTGIATAGTYDVIVSHPAYETFVASIELENGELTILNVELGGAATQAVSGLVIEAGTGNPIPGAQVILSNPVISYEVTADAAGAFSLPAVIESDYKLYAGSWGHHNIEMDLDVEGSVQTMTIELEEGYLDDFIIDYDWEVQGTASSGNWERGEPDGTTYNNDQCNPDFDVNGDVGNLCYVTGNAGGSAGNDDVDNGSTRLTSPIMDLSTYNQPVLKFNYWFFNDGGQSFPNDKLVVSVTDGTLIIEVIDFNVSGSTWKEQEINLADFITPNDQIQITFSTSDQVGDNFGHLVEAGIDAFEVYEGNPVAVLELDQSTVDIVATPNPFRDNLTVQYDFENIPNQATLMIYNLVGQAVAAYPLEASRGSIEINDLRDKGIYFLQVEADGIRTKAMKVVKQ
jgi:choice-of-anchor B domain-containing protein